MDKNKQRNKKYKNHKEKNSYRVKNYLRQAYTCHKTMIEISCSTTMIFKCKKITKQVLSNNNKLIEL